MSKAKKKSSKKIDIDISQPYITVDKHEKFILISPSKLLTLI